MGSIEESPILIVGAGPIGMLLAYQLARLGVPCILAEQSHTTTRWPKMDLTNCRSMEILRMLGICDAYRALSVPEQYNLDSHFSTGMGPGAVKIASWDQDAPKAWRQRIFDNNDGSEPAEPWVRCSQTVLEAYLKQLCQRQSLIDGRWGTKFVSLKEDEEGVTSTLATDNGETYQVRSSYVVGSDGGASRVRPQAGISMIGGPLPMAFFLVHFRSKELANLRPYGRFWHSFFTNGSFIIDQDEQDTFTSHWFLDDLENTDVTKIDPQQAVYNALGGTLEPFHFKIDEILIHSAWRPNFAVATKYASEGGRVILAGDACHRMPPHGGYGMNSGVEEALDLGWKLAAMINGYGGEYLLPSYTHERRPTIIRNLQRCHRHFCEHPPYLQMAGEAGPTVNEDGEKGQGVRAKIKAHLDHSGSEVTNRGIELDARYNRSPVIVRDIDGSHEPEFDLFRFVPDTWPGQRAPHVWLQDGKTSTVDLVGKMGKALGLFVFTPFEFPKMDTTLELFKTQAEELGIPLDLISMHHEDHVRSIWHDRDLVLVRPDGHVAWRSSSKPSQAQLSASEVQEVLEVVVGKREAEGWREGPWPTETEMEKTFENMVHMTNAGGSMGSEKFLAGFQKEVN